MKTIHTIEAHQVVVAYDEKEVVHGVSLKIPPNQISVMIGANACGKSTLLKAMTRILPPKSGYVSLDGRPIMEMKPKELAKVCGLLPQTPIVPDGITVGDLVSRGRYPHQKMFHGKSKEDLRAIAEAIEIMKIGELVKQNMSELSGGQRQRVWIATALAQNTDILFLDEPTTYLDMNFQVEILDLMADLNRKKKTTIVMVLHDMNLACRYADYIFAIKEGRLEAEGKPGDIISEQLIERVFSMKSHVTTDPVSGTPLVIPIGRNGCHTPASA